MNSLTDIRGDGGYVNQADHTLIDARGCNRGATVGMSDKNDRAADAVERAFDRCHIPFE